MVSVEECNKIQKGSCGDCEVYGRYLEAMREDAWERAGKPVGLPRDWFKTVYERGVRADEVIKECPEDRRAIPGRPKDAEFFIVMMERKTRESRSDIAK